MSGPQFERYHDLCVGLPADEDAASAHLRKVIEEGESRGWKLLSATKEPDSDVLVVTWGASGFLPG